MGEPDLARPGVPDQAELSLAEVQLGDTPQRVRLQLYADIKGERIEEGLGHLEVRALGVHPSQSRHPDESRSLCVQCGSYSTQVDTQKMHALLCQAAAVRSCHACCHLHACFSASGCLHCASGPGERLLPRRLKCGDHGAVAIASTAPLRRGVYASGRWRCGQRSAPPGRSRRWGRAWTRFRAW